MADFSAKSFRRSSIGSRERGVFRRRRPGYSNPLIAELARAVRSYTGERTPSDRRDADSAAGRSGIWVGVSARTGDARKDACGERYIFGLSAHLLSGIYNWRRRRRGGRNTCDIPVLVLHAIREHTILVDAGGAGRVDCHAGGLLADYQPVNRFWLQGQKLGPMGSEFFSTGVKRSRGSSETQPVDWMYLRDRWELSHVARAVLATFSLIAIVAAVATGS
jgi:hypothetical protein